MNRAKIIVIEGTDGSGKATQSEKLMNYYKGKGLKVKSFSFPIYNSPTGKIVGGSYLGKSDIGESVFSETSASVDPLVSSLFFAADRRYNFLKEIESELYTNDIIILDRYTTSNMGHQVGKGKNDKEREQILNFINKLEFDLCELPKPDIVIFLHMPLEATSELRKNRTCTDGNESSKEHLINAENAYLFVSNKLNWEYINCIKKEKYESINDIKSIDEIFNEIVSLIEKKDIKNNIIKKMTRF